MAFFNTIAISSYMFAYTYNEINSPDQVKELNHNLVENTSLGKFETSSYLAKGVISIGNSSLTSLKNIINLQNAMTKRHDNTKSVKKSVYDQEF